MHWNMRRSSPPGSHLELPAKASDLWMFQMFGSVGMGWGAPASLSAARSLRRLRAVFCIHASSSEPETRAPQCIIRAPGGVADSAFVASSLVMPALLLQKHRGSTGEEIWLRSEGPGSSPSCVIVYWSEPERDHLAALWLSFSFCGVVNN